MEYGSLVLKQLNRNDSTNIYQMLQKIGIEENKFHNGANGLTFNQFKDWLLIQDKWSRGEDLPIDYVRQWTFWLYDGIQPVGFGKLREKLTEKSRLLGGNIGYAIIEPERGKGYGTRLFMMLLKKAKELGILEVMSTVEKANPSSKAIHEKCGGVLINENSRRWYFSFDEVLKNV